MLVAMSGTFRFAFTAGAIILGVAGCSGPGELNADSEGKNAPGESAEVSLVAWTGSLTETLAKPVDGLIFDAAYLPSRDSLALLGYFPMESSNLSVQFLDPETLQPQDTVALPQGLFAFTESGFGGDLTGSFFSPDGTRLVLTSEGTDQAVPPGCVVIDSGDGTLVASLPTNGSLGCNSSWDADGSSLYVAGFPSSTISVFDAESLNPVRELITEFPPIHLAGLNGYVGYTQGSFETEGMIVFYEPGDVPGFLTELPDWLVSVKSSANLSEIVSFGHEQPLLTFTNPTTGEKRQSSPLDSSLTSFAIAPDGSVVVAATRSNQITLVDSQSGEVLGSLAVSDNPARALVFGPNQALLYVATSNGVVIVTGG
jgi:DNA-binding beta-propeller fold protein YncE